MHVAAFSITILILLSRKACQALIEYIDSQRIYACHQYIEPDIKFQPINQQRIAYVTTDNAQLVDWNVWYVID